jgi:hypothetical protein
MNTVSWIALGAAAMGLSLACGSGDTRAPAGGDAGTGGKRPGSDSGAGGRGTGGRASGGAGGSVAAGGSDAGLGGAGGGPVVPPPDKTPPRFGGITGAVGAGADRVTVSWAPATDPETPKERIVYIVYRASQPGAEDFSAARRCGAPLADAGSIDQAGAPCFVVAPAGATSAIVPDAVPGRGYTYMVRAVDAAGNHDTNTVEKTLAVDDATQPEFGGVRAVSALSPTSISVEWGAGYDLGTPDTGLVFKIFVTTKAAPDPDNSTPVYTSKAGEHSAVLTGLDSETKYAVLVRAYDAKGNHDGNIRSLKVVTPEGVPPAFSGARQASAAGTTVTLFWPPATDNLTDPANIEYDVYQSLRTHAQNFATVSYPSKPGASSISIPDLAPGTTYYYVVRARDAAGNRDGNIVQVQVTTDPVDKTPPAFGGPSTVTSPTPGSLLVTWGVAQDDFSAVADITYLVYVAPKSQLPLSATAAPTSVVRAATSVTIAGLAPGSTRCVVVRAKDAVGNVQVSTDSEKCGTTTAATGTDTTAPVTPSNPVVTQLIATPTKLSVSWTAATDPPNPDTDIRYLVCASPVEADCRGASFNTHVAAVTAFGTTNTVLANLTPHTPYYVFVRAEDRSGNLEVADHEQARATAASWKTNVKPILFSRCIACHATYDNPSAFVGVPSGFYEDQACGAVPLPDGCPLKLIDPGRPEFSLIYRKVNPLNLSTPPFSLTVPNAYSKLQMPRDTGAKLTGPEDDIIRDWITQGALAN